IQPARQLDHGFGLVQLRGVEDFLAAGAETGLRRLQNRSTGFAFARHVEQSEEQALRAHPPEIMQISARARREKSYRHVSALEWGALPLHDPRRLFRCRAETEF